MQFVQRDNKHRYQRELEIGKTSCSVFLKYKAGIYAKENTLCLEKAPTFKVGAFIRFLSEIQLLF